MRILAVRGENLASITAFDLDFEAEPLRSAGLFAITGPTGAGKSTILDAICLALYDQLPRLDNVGGGARRDEGGREHGIALNDPRSALRHGAGAGFAEVDFVGCDRRKYRARWSVRRARGRAAGKLQSPEQTLFDLDIDVLLEKKRTEAKRAIEHRVGLSFEQFRRATLLAQGDFDAFIRAGAKDRADLLERITGAGIYARLSKAAHVRAAAAKEAIKTIEARLAEHRPLSLEERAAVETHLDHASARRKLFERDLLDVQKALDWSEERRRRAISRNEACGKANAAEIALKHLFERAFADGEAALQTSLTRRNRAQDWLDKYPAAIALAARLEDTLTDLEIFAAVSIERRRQEKEYAQIAYDERRLAPRLAQLLNEKTTRAKAVETAETALAEKQAAADAIDGASADRRQRALRAVERGVSAARAAARAGRQAKTAINVAEQERTDAIDRAASTEREIAALDAAAPALKVAADAAERAALSWRTAGEDAAIRLRAALTPGEHCPVCGSLEHAAGDFDAAVKRELDAALAFAAERRQAVNDAEARRTALAERGAHDRAKAVEAERRKAEADTALQTARSAWLATMKELSALSLDDDQTVADAVANARGAANQEEALGPVEAAIIDALGDAEATLTAARTANTALRNALEENTLAQKAFRQADAALAQAQSAQTDLRERRLEAETAIATASARQEDRGAALDLRLSAVLPAWRDDQPAGIARHVKEWAGAASNAQRDLAEAEETARNLRHHLTELAERQSSALLPSQAQADHGVRPNEAERISPAPLESLADPSRARAMLGVAETQLAQARAAAEIANQALTEHDALKPAAIALSLPAASDKTSPVDAVRGAPIDALDEEALRAAQDASAAAFADAGVDQEDAAFTLRQDDAARQASAEIANLLEKTRADAQVWKRLDDLIGSADGSKFRRFAQALTLRQLVALANRRLKELHPRYALDVAGAADDLALDVVDQDMGDERRSVHNLSGGERFLISLALALGLSALSSESGVQVESLFIDEGFGALDSDSFALAMSALEALQATGRRVGVITHVEDAKERIPVKITVSPQGLGVSSVAVVSEVASF